LARTAGKANDTGVPPGCSRVAWDRYRVWTRHDCEGAGRMQDVLCQRLESCDVAKRANPRAWDPAGMQGGEARRGV